MVNITTADKLPFGEKNGLHNVQQKLNHLELVVIYRQNDSSNWHFDGSQLRMICGMSIRLTVSLSVYLSV